MEAVDVSVALAAFYQIPLHHTAEVIIVETSIVNIVNQVV
jgi:hypothetical protein